MSLQPPPQPPNFLPELWEPTFLHLAPEQIVKLRAVLLQFISSTTSHWFTFMISRSTAAFVISSMGLLKHNTESIYTRLDLKSNTGTHPSRSLTVGSNLIDIVRTGIPSNALSAHRFLLRSAWILPLKEASFVLCYPVVLKPTTALFSCHLFRGVSR